MRKLWLFAPLAILVGCDGAMIEGEEEGLDDELTATVAPACHTPLASVGGTWAYSNGTCQGSGSCNCGGWGTNGWRYQCVELAQRYFHSRGWSGPIFAGVDGAKDICGKGLPPNSIPIWPNQLAGNGGTYLPKRGDLFVKASGTWGHVAVIDSIQRVTLTTGTTYNYRTVEQNSSTTGRRTYRPSSALCVVHSTRN